MHGDSAACSRPAALRLSLACELGEVRDAVKTIHDFLAGHGWSETELLPLDLALIEACNNAVKYAGEAGRKLPVELEANCDAARAEFRIHDHTPGFEWPRQVKLPAAESEEGRGLYLIHSLMDSAEYFRGREGNILILRKVRSIGQAAAGGNLFGVPPSGGKAGASTVALKISDAPVTAAAPPPEGATPYSGGEPARQLAQSERVIRDMVEELSSCYESLSAIFRYSAEVGKSRNLQEFAQRLFGDLLDIIAAEWFVLRLVPRNEARLVEFTTSELALVLEPLAFPTAGEPAQSVELEAALIRKRVWFEPANERAETEPLQRAKPNSAGLVYPILLGEELIGTLALGKPFTPDAAPSPGKTVFTAAQTQVVNMFADFLAIQIANARSQEEQVNRRLVTHELEIAQNIQRSLLLAELPQLPGFSLAGFCRSAREVGGDFYDALTIDDHSLLLVIADVMGKGVPAAMFAAILRSLLRASPELAAQPAALLTRVNRQLYQELSGVEMFITAQLAFIDARARRMVTASAGHCPLALASPDEVRTFSPEGMPLGILPDTKFQDEAADLPPHCRVLLYTDGVSDAQNAKREQFTQQRLIDWLQRTTTRPRAAGELQRELIRELDAHQLNSGPQDDQTFLIVAG